MATEEIVATWEVTNQRFENPNGDVLIGTCDRDGQDVSVRCNEDEEEHPKEGLTYRFYGNWTKYTYKRTGKTINQFFAKTFVASEPMGRLGITTYLRQVPGIGPGIAAQLWEKFKDKSVETLRTLPDVAAAAIPRLKADVAEVAATDLREKRHLELTMIDLMNLLGGFGFPGSVYKEIVLKLGNKAAKIIKEDPFELMNFSGCGFKRADALYLSLGHDPTSLHRQSLCAWYAIASNGNGDTWLYSEVARRGLLNSIGGAEVRDSEAIRAAIFNGLLASIYTDEQNGKPHWDGKLMWLATGHNARNEARLASMASRAMRSSDEWPAMKQGSLSDHQFEQLQKCLESPLAILGGGPGTGKTYCAAELIKNLLNTYPAQEIGVVCPTGKAAVRLSEAMHDYQIPLRAQTIHSLLQVESTNGEAWKFVRGPENTLPLSVLIVDEVSMLDTNLAYSLFAARAAGTLVLLIGDVNQLLPVGHGAPLRDMIAAGVPYGELTEVRRNSGAIVECCKSIREGTGAIYEPGGNLDLIHALPGAEQVAAMIGILQEQAGFHPVWDCQVICAVNKNSPLSRQKLNETMQEVFNGTMPKVPGSPFKQHDKIVNTKNTWHVEAKEWIRENRQEYMQLLQRLSDEEAESIAKPNLQGQFYVANGELGRVLHAESKRMVVSLQAPFRVILVPRGKVERVSEDEEEKTDTGCNWELGYALSCHKMQGSEIPVAVIMLDESGGAMRVCDRAWIYTAISRAKEHCFLIGRKEAIEAMCQKNRINQRKTFLKDLILAKLEGK